MINKVMFNATAFVKTAFCTSFVLPLNKLPSRLKLLERRYQLVARRLESVATACKVLKVDLMCPGPEPQHPAAVLLPARVPGLAVLLVQRPAGAGQEGSLPGHGPTTGPLLDSQLTQHLPHR